MLLHLSPVKVPGSFYKHSSTVTSSNNSIQHTFKVPRKTHIPNGLSAGALKHRYIIHGMLRYLTLSNLSSSTEIANDDLLNAYNLITIQYRPNPTSPDAIFNRANINWNFVLRYQISFGKVPRKVCSNKDRPNNFGLILRF